MPLYPVRYNPETKVIAPVFPNDSGAKCSICQTYAEAIAPQQKCITSRYYDIIKLIQLFECHRECLCDCPPLPVDEEEEETPQ